MPSGSSSRRPRGIGSPAKRNNKCDSSRSPSNTSRVSFSGSRRSTSFSGESSNASSFSSCTTSPAPSSRTSGKSFLSAEQTMAPDMTINPGDRKEVYELSDKGKLVHITRKNGDIVYMLRCVDGRRVYIEKTSQGACLMLTNQKGKIVKALAGQY